MCMGDDGHEEIQKKKEKDGYGDLGCEWLNGGGL